ncbi:hypothetical protein, partial [Gordonia aichiensis]
GAFGAGAAVAVTIGLLSAGAANADTFVPLPDGQKNGPGVTVSRTGESAIVSPSLAANGAGRVVWVSGNARADVQVTPEGEVGPWNGPSNRPGSNNSSTHGASQLSTGYIVGCQVSIGDDAIGGQVGVGLDTNGPIGEGSIGLDLGSLVASACSAVIPNVALVRGRVHCSDSITKMYPCNSTATPTNTNATAVIAPPSDRPGPHRARRDYHPSPHRRPGRRAGSRPGKPLARHDRIGMCC